MRKYSFISLVLVISLLATLSMAYSSEWVIYINNKPFTGTFSISKDVAMVSLAELAEKLKVTYEYNELTNLVKINETVYAGQKEVKDGKLMVSLESVANMFGAKFELDSKAYTVSMQTFQVQLAPNPTPVVEDTGNDNTGPQQKGDELQVTGLREMTEGEKMGFNQDNVTTVGVTGTVQNTSEYKANDVVVTVYVKDGTGKLQETLTSQIGTLEAGASAPVNVFFNDGSIYFDPLNPAIVYKGIQWVYTGEVTFKLDIPPQVEEIIP